MDNCPKVPYKKTHAALILHQLLMQTGYFKCFYYIPPETGSEIFLPFKIEVYIGRDKVKFLFFINMSPGSFSTDTKGKPCIVIITTIIIKIIPGLLEFRRHTLQNPMSA